MKKSIFLAAVAALVLAGCAKNETYVKVANQDEVNFGAYSGRTITKAGSTDDMNLDALKDHGFGVFATYTGTKDFNDASLTGATNDFMYNQMVKWYDANGDGITEWEYAPVKYWPNPTNGKADDDQYVSFFAYAPYADPEAAAADNTYGITGFEIIGGHNVVDYTFAANKPNVDLMWGYKTGATLNTWTLGTNDENFINLDLTRSLTKVGFTFQHVLSKLGGSQEGEPKDPEAAGYQANGLIVKANPVSIDPTNGFGEDDGTKITVSSIIVQSAPEEDPVGTPVVDANGNNVSYATSDQTGKLDLYTGEFVLDGTAKSIQFYQELTADPAAVAADPSLSEIADYLKEPATVSSFAALPKGVTAVAKNVYQDESNPLILVPGTAPVVDVQITYIVRTYDAKLGTKKYSEVPQTVWGRVKFPTIEKNKKYNLLMILGLNDVKFEATVEDWSKGSTWVDANGNGVVDPGELTGTDQTIGLPNNL